MAKDDGLAAIAPAELAARLGQPGIFIGDCNPKRVWVRGHVPGAVNLDPAGYTEADLPVDHDAALIFYCSDPSCGASPYAARRARKMGYTHVYVMRVGISGWIEAGLEVEKG